MKRIIVLALVFAVGLSVAAFAGFYFSIENAGFNLSPELTLGVDFGVMLDSQTPPIILTGDFYTMAPDIFAAPNVTTAWALGAALGLSLGYMDCDFETYIMFNPANYPNDIEIVEGSELSLILTGYPGYPVEIWGGLELAYKTSNKWLFEPVFGFEAHW